MADRDTRPRRRPTSTSAFGAGRRESHDSSAFYARFKPPVIGKDDRIGSRPETEGPILGDARRMQQIPDRSVALVVTSPPYFVGKAYENEILQVAQPNSVVSVLPRTYREYLQLLYDSFYECIRVLEPGGRIAVNVANLGRKPYRSLSADVIKIFEDPSLQVYDNPEQHLACCYDESQALCHPSNDRRPGIRQSPDLLRCDPRCANTVRTDSHMDALGEEVKSLEAQIASPITPVPMQVRLGQRRDRLLTVKAEHEQKRLVTAPEVL